MTRELPDGAGRVLMVSPHFPPDTGAASHRVRLLAPHLAEFGWEPTILTVEAADLEGRLDPTLLEMVPGSLRVRRCRAWSPRWTRRLGFGDLGLRAFSGLGREASRLLREEDFDALFVTIFPAYPALLGPWLKRRFDLAFVLDYQDPWVSAWGLSTGGGRDGSPDFKSRMSRRLALRLEPRAVRAADAITAVSELTYRQIKERYPETAAIPCESIPLGGEAADFEHLRRFPRANLHFDAKDGNYHLSYVGTLLPLGLGTLRAFLTAVAALKRSHPDVYRRLRLHFFGTSNQTSAGIPARVHPEARALGVDEVVSEEPSRIDYLDALTVLSSSSGVLLMGSSEPHYTASKIYPALLSGRPLLALYHRKSSVVQVLESSGAARSVRQVTYDEERPAGRRTEEMARALAEMIEADPGMEADHDPTLLERYSARSMAKKLARVLAEVRRRRSARSQEHGN